MGRLPGNGVPTFRFLPTEVAEMEATALQVTGSIFPPSDVIEALTAKFNAAPDRAGKVPVQPKQVVTWFHNRRYAPRSKEIKARKAVKTVRWESNLHRTSSSSVPPPAQTSALSGRKRIDSGKSIGEMIPPWTPVQYSIPFQPKECVDVHCRDLILCYQDREELPFHCDARVLAAQRTRHDSRECHCKFLVRYEHDQTEEIVPLARLRRRSVSNYRLPNLYAASRVADSADCSVQPTEAANVDLTSNENSSRAKQLDPKQDKLMGVNTHEATMASNSEQEKPEDNGVGALPATSPETCHVSASGVAIKSVEAAAPEIIEIDDD